MDGLDRNCWMYHFFSAHIHLELHMNEKALRTYFALQKAGFLKSTYIKSQIAIAYHNVQSKHCFRMFLYAIGCYVFKLLLSKKRL